jgi:hypothetical protein
MKPMSASGRFCCKTPLKAQREQTRLRSMLAQVTMLPEGARAKIPRDIHEHARDVARSLVGTEAFEQSRRDRKRIEMRFAHLKRILRLGRLRLRGPRGAQVEFTLAAIAQTSGAWGRSVAALPRSLAVAIRQRLGGVAHANHGIGGFHPVGQIARQKQGFRVGVALVPAFGSRS